MGVDQHLQCLIFTDYWPYPFEHLRYHDTFFLQTPPWWFHIVVSDSHTWNHWYCSTVSIVLSAIKYAFQICACFLHWFTLTIILWCDWMALPWLYLMFWSFFNHSSDGREKGNCNRKWLKTDRPKNFEWVCMQATSVCILLMNYRYMFCIKCFSDYGVEKLRATLRSHLIQYKVLQNLGW